MYNLIEYNDKLKTLGSLWQHYGEDPDDNIVNSQSFRFEINVTGNTNVVKIAVPLKYLSNFWRTLGIPLINCELILILTWSEICVISSGTGETKFCNNKYKPLCLNRNFSNSR